MNRVKSALAMTGLVACFSMSAYADTVYDWTLTGAGLDGSGTISLGASTSGPYGTGNLADAASGSILIDINGTTSDLTITGVGALSAFGGFSSNNNIVYPTATAGENVDTDGLGLQLSNGEVLTVRNVYPQTYDDAVLYSSAGAQNAYSSDTFAVTQPTVPVPPSVILMLSGLLGAGLFAVRGARKGAAFLPSVG
jgi:hypothetical protein